MRMQELEAKSGVNRETIRFYIREGLLPEPNRTGRTSAQYDDAHVVKLRAIKRLQDERHLPLAVIRALLNNGNAETVSAASAFPELEADLRSRLMMRSAAAERIDHLATRVGYGPEDIANLVHAGVINLHQDEQGFFWVKGTDVVLTERCAALKSAGFTAERGFSPATLRMYLDFTEWLVDAELRMFLNTMAANTAKGDIASVAERGIDIMNDVLSLLRTRSILAKMDKYRDFLSAATEQVPAQAQTQTGEAQAGSN